MPFLEQENFAEGFKDIFLGNGTGEAKFIREAAIILYDSRVDKKSHDDLAKEAGLTSPTDAGFLNTYMHGPDDRKLEISGKSSTLGLPKFATEREETLRVMQELARETNIVVNSVPTPPPFIPRP